MQTNTCKDISTKCYRLLICFLVSQLIFLPKVFAEQSLHLNLATQVHDYIDENLRTFSNDQYTIKVKKIDNRIQIKPCPEGYVFDANFSRRSLSKLPVKVRCQSNNWFLYAQADVKQTQTVAVLKNTLSPGTSINANDLELVAVDKASIRGTTFHSLEQLVGARVKRRLRAQSILSDNMLCFVCKGDRIIISAQSKGLSLKVYGIAQQDGVVGDTIQVKNSSTDKLVYAKIASVSEVKIDI